MVDYIHKYSDQEAKRLYDQASILEPYIHRNIVYKAGEMILEVGCGVGAQSIVLARNNPTARFTSIDSDAGSIDRAKEISKRLGLSNIEFHTIDLLKMPFKENTFDHVFICFVLEHLPDAKVALGKLREVLKNNGTITITEGYGKSERYFPITAASRVVWDSYFKLHTNKGGNPYIGENLYGLLSDVGFNDIKTSPVEIVGDNNSVTLKKKLLSELILPAFNGIKEEVLENGYVDKATWEKGMQDFKNIINDESGLFCYSWLQAIAKK